MRRGITLVAVLVPLAVLPAIPASAGDTATITASANNAFQFAPGTNSTANSLQVGGGGSGEVGFRAVTQGMFASPNDTIVLANGVTTFAVTSNTMTIDGDPGGNTIATITGGLDGQLLTLIFVDTDVDITDDNTHAADTVDLSAAFTSADDTVLQLVFDGTSWYEVSRSVN